MWRGATSRRGPMCGAACRPAADSSSRHSTRPRRAGSSRTSPSTWRGPDTAAGSWRAGPTPTSTWPTRYQQNAQHRAGAAGELANVGAVARVMSNTGLTRLVLVAPGDFRTVECWRSAWGAHDVLETLVERPDLEAALRDYDHTVAIPGALRPSIRPRTCALQRRGLRASDRACARLRLRSGNGGPQRRRTAAMRCAADPGASRPAVAQPVACGAGRRRSGLSRMAGTAARGRRRRAGRRRAAAEPRRARGVPRPVARRAHRRGGAPQRRHPLLSALARLLQARSCGTRTAPVRASRDKPAQMQSRR